MTTPSGALTAAERLGIYADAYCWRLCEVLQEDFPRLATLLGSAGFAALAREYLRQSPSANPSVRHLGDGFAAFVARAQPRAAHLADLARLERARVDVFDAADDDALSVDALRAIAPAEWPGLRFVPIRALRVLRLDWPVLALWEDEAVVPDSPSPTVVRVWRAADFRVFHAPLELRAARAFDRMLQGQPFEAMCGAFADLAPEEGATLATGLLARWFADGLVARLG